MFRAAAAGPYDEAVAKSTDENLTSEDWGAIIEVCDKVTSDQNGPKEVVQSMIKRLAHRNANVQLYTLELAHALCQNCGKSVHREVSSRAFTDALLKLANDRNTHSQVKTKILEKMQDWSDMFNKDPELGIMYDAYFRLKQSNPTLQAPSAPQKQGLTDADRQKEDDELQMALKLSLQDEERKKTPASSAAPAGASGQQQAPSAAAAPVQAGTTAATVSRVRALYDFVPSEPGELEFKKGDIIAVLESVYKDWWRGSLRGKTGIFPLNYVEKLTDPTPDELQREAQMEAEVFAEIKNVEKLLTLLSTSNSAPREEDNEEISKLYHQTLAIRPKLIKLIEKYSQKKDDFTQLNEKFIKARRDYESLLESSMSQAPQHPYQQYGMRPGGYPQQPYGMQGAPPPQQDYQRYYTPGPQEPQSQPQGPPQAQHPHQPYGAPVQAQGPPGAYPGQPQAPPGAYPGAEPQGRPASYHQPPDGLGRPGPQGPSGPQGPPEGQPSYSMSSAPANYPPRTGSAPFYVGGAEVPSNRQENHQPPPSNQQFQPVGHQPPPQQLNNKQPAPINTSPTPQQYTSYSPPPQGASGPYGQPGRPQSTYGAQELATSVYDSPIAPHNPTSAGTYTSSVYSQDEEHLHNQHDNASAPPPGPYAVQHHPFQGYNPADQAPPSAPTQQPPPPPPDAMAPPPLQPAGAAYDARQSLPSQSPPAQATSAPQYKPYIPPGGIDGPSAPAPNDYYRSGGSVY